MSPAPGVIVTTGLRAGPAQNAAPLAAQAFLPVRSAWGPSAPQRITSAAEYEALFPLGPAKLLGGSAITADAYLASVRTFFEEGGQALNVRRVVGPNAVQASKVLADAVAAPSITLRAVYPGAVGNNFRVTVAAGTSPNTAKLTISEAAPSGLLPAPVVLDDLATAAAAAAAVNGSPALAGRLTAVAGNGARPAVAAIAPLTGGTADGGEGTALLDTDWSFPPDLGPGAIIGTGITTLAGIAAAADMGDAAAILYPVLLSAEANRRIIILDGYQAGESAAVDDLGDAIVELKAELLNLLKTSLDDDAAAERLDELLSFVGVFYPLVMVPGVAVPIPPATYVAGVRARTIATYGLTRAPAGEVSVARYVEAPATVTEALSVIGDAEAAAIDAAGLNAIRYIAGTTRVYGWRSLAGPSGDWAFLSARDTMNVLADEADRRAESLAFRPIDASGHIFAELRAMLIGVAEEAKATGVLYARTSPTTGLEVDPGYAVDVGPEINTDATKAAGEVLGVLAVRLAPTAALIRVAVVKVALTGAI